jgi:hypothetical protein
MLLNSMGMTHTTTCVMPWTQAERYFVEAGLQFEKIQKQEQLTQALQNTQDWTAYYRNMRTVDNPVKSMQVVKRFHRGSRR